MWAFDTPTMSGCWLIHNVKMIQDICLLVSVGSQFVHAVILPLCIEYNVWLDQAGNWSCHNYAWVRAKHFVLEREKEFGSMVQSD